MKHTKTLKVRVKDKHAPLLKSMARSVNFVWNYLNELSHRSIVERGRFLSEFDLHPYTKGAGKELGLHSQTLQCIAKEYVTRRKQFKKNKLNWRKSAGSKRSLGWIPMNTGASSFKCGQVFHNGHYFKVWDSFGLSQYPFRTASFNEDARGRWYFNVVVEVDIKPRCGTSSVGIDLGLKDAAVSSNGDRLENNHYRHWQAKLGLAQRANHSNRVKALHAKIKHKRHNDIHQFTRQLVNHCGAIFVGNIQPMPLTKTKLAKSVLDAGWGLLNTTLEYKCHQAGVLFERINESYTTQTCSCCHQISANSPKGRAGLRIREWTCECGITHDRDINAAKNILALGHERLAGGIPTL